MIQPNVDNCPLRSSSLAIPVCGKLTAKADLHTWGQSFISIEGCMFLTNVSDGLKSAEHSMNSFFQVASQQPKPSSTILEYHSTPSELKEANCVAFILSHIHAVLCSRCDFELGAWIT